MGGKVKLLVGLSLLASISVWSTYRIGLFRRDARVSSEGAQTKAGVPVPGVTISSTASSIASSVQSAPGPCPASNSSSAPLNADDTSAFIAFRYDRTHLVFRIGNEETQFCLSPSQLKSLRKLDATIPDYKKDDFLWFPGTDLWEPNPAVLSANRLLFDLAHSGEQWELELSANSRIPVIVQQPVIGTYDSYFAGFLAEVAPTSQLEFAASTQQFFLIHKVTSTGRGSTTDTPTIGPLPEWKATPELEARIERILNARMQAELAAVRTQSAPEYERYSAETWNKSLESVPGGWAKQWKEFDEKLSVGEGKLDYDAQGFLLTPDSVPRVFVRARWTIEQKPAFLLSLWLRAGPELTVEAVDASWSRTMRMREFSGAALDRRYLGTILNVFDPDSDGHGALLIFRRGYEGVGITLYRYTNAGPLTTPISCNSGA